MFRDTPKAHLARKRALAYRSQSEMAKIDRQRKALLKRAEKGITVNPSALVALNARATASRIAAVRAH